MWHVFKYCFFNSDINSNKNNRPEQVEMHGWGVSALSDEVIKAGLIPGNN